MKEKMKKTIIPIMILSLFIVGCGKIEKTHLSLWEYYTCRVDYHHDWEIAKVKIIWENEDYYLIEISETHRQLRAKLGFHKTCKPVQEFKMLSWYKQW